MQTHVCFFHGTFSELASAAVSVRARCHHTLPRRIGQVRHWPVINPAIKQSNQSINHQFSHQSSITQSSIINQASTNQEIYKIHSVMKLGLLQGLIAYVRKNTRNSRAAMATGHRCVATCAGPGRATPPRKCFRYEIGPLGCVHADGAACAKTRTKLPELSAPSSLSSELL